MAKPIVTVAATPASVPATGGQVTVKINAHDPDVGSPAKIFVLEGFAESSDGEKMPARVEVARDGIPGDTIVGYELVDVDNAGVEIAQDPNDPSAFVVTIPPVA